MGTHEIKRGNCYAASEALYHIMGGKKAGWKPMRFPLVGPNARVDTHWFLKHTSGMIVDVSVRQFKSKPDYTKARGSGFLTKGPSKRAREIMKRLTWQ